MASKTQAVQFYLPPGRMVGGSMHELQTKDQQGRDREKPGLYFAVAVPKTEPTIAGILQTISQVAWQHYQNVASIADQLKQGLSAPNFAWKVEDGDAPKHAGREGYAGCWVFRFSTSIIPIKTGDSQDNPIDPTTIKCGFYIDVLGSCAVNGLTDKNAGVYLNPNGVRLLGYGKEIQIGPSIAQMFANRQASLPPGASALPVTSGPPAGAPAPINQPPAGGAPALGGPGFAAGVTPPPAPGALPPPPPPGVLAATPVTVEMIQAESAQLATAAGVQHYPGHRIKPDRSGYDPDPTPGLAPTAAPPAPAALGGPVVGASTNPMTPGVSVPGVPAGATSGGAVPAPGIVPNGSPATASPSSPPPGVQPHPGFLQPPAQQTPDQISEAIAVANGVQHYPGYRLDVGTRQYLPNPV